MERAWPALLTKYGIDAPFHMAEFMARQHHFTSWSGTDADQKAFRTDAARLIRRNTNKPFAVGVALADFRRMFEVYDVPDAVPRQPYPWCALKACDHLFDWMRNRMVAGTLAGTDQLEIVFEHGDRDQGKFAEALRKKHQLSVTFRANHGKTWVPFAACDWLAWEFRHFLVQRTKGYRLQARANALPSRQDRGLAKLKAATLIADQPVLREIATMLPRHALTCTTWETITRNAALQGWPRKP